MLIDKEMCAWDIQGTGLVEIFYVPIIWG